MDEDEDDDDLDANDGSWKAHALRFADESKVRDPMARKEEEYTVIDPLKFAKHVKPMSQHRRRLLGSNNPDL